MPLDTDSLTANREISPGKTHFFHAYACRIYVDAYSQISDFSVTCHLIRRRRLVCGCCSSGQRFATGFLQTPPRDDALAFR